ncbi:MFS transporter [Actinomycetospora chibensis]|uniref:MFS transporter n=1 Tax=Actinomycetospora chibensis TaxID=663606 RepID=A0ABV9RQH3_9PSEU|nr:MFS transporter [Actinomycetospora chibensis]MDD7924402.1 YbfB/YjiJ family MFS transporter [Actinomycetospora chibensis]
MTCVEATTRPASAHAGERAGTVPLALSGLLLIAVCYGLARFAYGLFVPVFRTEFALDAATVGAIASSSYVGYCVAIVASTAAAARWGARAVAVAAGLCAATGTGLIALAANTTVLTIGVVVAGSSTGLASPPLAQAIAHRVPAGRADRVQTVVNAGTGLGVLVSGPVALLLADTWRWAWAAFGLAALGVTVAVAVTVPRAIASRPVGGGTLPARPRAWRRRLGTARLLAAAVVLGAGSSAVWTFGRDVVSSAGASELVSTGSWIVLGAAGLLGALAGDAVARLGLARAWSAAMLLVAAATLALGLAASTTVAVFAGAAVFGGVYIALSGMLLLWGTRVFPDRPVLGVGAGFLLLALGQALGAPLLGLLADHLSLAGAFLAATALLVLGAAVRPRPEQR